MAQRRSRTPNIDPRSQSRERALTLLYEADTKNVSGHTVIAGLVEPPDTVSLLIVRGVADNQEVIDGLISEHADGWTMNRMPCLDRNILRMATFELLHRLDIPQAVILDEAVQLAKTFSTDDSSRYVNGVLSAIAKSSR
ncbi:MAG: transcription antitermination factor NusB [Ilumatobacteraceae bacterium]|jgi:N utilization substance protein B|nr:transcription antitermination factor NusB [Ilumatobacteraceae bacterium]